MVEKFHFFLQKRHQKCPFGNTGMQDDDVDFPFHTLLVSLNNNRVFRCVCEAAGECHRPHRDVGE